MANELYLTSTPLHLLNAIAIASSRPDHQSHIILIDQPVVKGNPYFSILYQWQDSPFSSLNIFQGRIKGIREKLAARKIIFSQLDDIIQNLNPSRIYTGNDRRIEFQYAMQSQLKQHDHQAVGIYMDEGTFTYVGRKDSASISDKYIDNVIKKLTYGFWWKNPITIGASDWIKELYAAFPNKVHPLLQGKQLNALQHCYENNTIVQSFCSELIKHFEAKVHVISQLDAILTLPHESIIDSIDGYRESMLSALDQLTGAKLKVGIKYHPRNTNPDILNCADKEGVSVLPHQIPFEAILPLLGECIIIGDISSTLINGRWLKPNAKILSIANPEVPLFDEFVTFFNDIGVTSIPVSQLQEQLQQVLNA